MDKIKMHEEWRQNTKREIEDLLPSDWSYCFGLVSVPDGSGGGAWSLSLIRKGGGRCSPISDKLLEKLRSVKGQVFFNSLPVFYEEYCKGWTGLRGPNADDQEDFDRLLDELSKPYREPKEQ